VTVVPCRKSAGQFAGCLRTDTAFRDPGPADAQR
jgi:hypothetical protein